MLTWLTAPNGAKQVNWTSATDWWTLAPRDNVINITLCRLIMLTFLIRPPTSQSSSYPAVLTRLGGRRSRPNSLLISFATLIRMLIPTHKLSVCLSVPLPFKLTIVLNFQIRSFLNLNLRITSLSWAKVRL